MTVDVVSEIVRAGLYTIIKTSAPVLLLSLIVGLIVSIFQTAILFRTDINFCS